jgi:hypothetical protein
MAWDYLSNMLYALSQGQGGLPLVRSITPGGNQEIGLQREAKKQGLSALIQQQKLDQQKSQDMGQAQPWKNEWRQGATIADEGDLRLQSERAQFDANQGLRARLKSQPLQVPGSGAMIDTPEALQMFKEYLGMGNLNAHTGLLGAQTTQTGAQTEGIKKETQMRDAALKQQLYLNQRMQDTNTQNDAAAKAVGAPGNFDSAKDLSAWERDLLGIQSQRQDFNHREQMNPLQVKGAEQELNSRGVESGMKTANEYMNMMMMAKDPKTGQIDPRMEQVFKKLATIFPQIGDLTKGMFVEGPKGDPRAAAVDNQVRNYIMQNDQQPNLQFNGSLNAPSTSGATPIVRSQPASGQQQPSKFSDQDWIKLGGQPRKIHSDKDWAGVVGKLPDNENNQAVNSIYEQIAKKFGIEPESIGSSIFKHSTSSTVKSRLERDAKFKEMVNSMPKEAWDEMFRSSLQGLNLDASNKQLQELKAMIQQFLEE